MEHLLNGPSKLNSNDHEEIQEDIDFTIFVKTRFKKGYRGPKCVMSILNIYWNK